MPLVPLFVMIALLSGCGQDDPPSSPPARTEAVTATTTNERPALRVRRATCPPDAGNCAAATGRIVYLESVDADGDGDLHLVLAGGSVTAPGISVLDIGKHLRPRRDPRIGDLASAAGPVYRGSFGQRQIEATELHIARR